MEIINFLTDIGNKELTLCLMGLASFRIYLEVISFNFQELPLTKKLGQYQGNQIHKLGLYLSLGYIILFAPGFLIS